MIKKPIDLIQDDIDALACEVGDHLSQRVMVSDTTRKFLLLVVDKLEAISDRITEL